MMFHDIYVIFFLSFFFFFFFCFLFFFLVDSLQSDRSIQTPLFP